MPRTCVTIAIIAKAKLKWPLLVNIQIDPTTQADCVKIATWPSTI